jgi:hypothetical protein
MYDLFNQPAPQFTGDQLADVGMRMARDHADQKILDWSGQCFELMKEYLKINDQPFMAEFFRQWAEGKIPDPPSKRAYGAVIVRAAKERLIRRTGYAKVSNYKAHSTPAAVWVRI